MPIIHEETVPAKQPWSRVIAANDILKITDLEGQQAVDFLCYDANDLSDRYSTMNTVKVQGNVYVGLGTILYSDSGTALMTVIEDTVGRHDTIYGCCSTANNRLRYGVETTETCYANFEHALAEHGLGKDAIVSNVNMPNSSRTAMYPCAPKPMSLPCCPTARKCTTPVTAITPHLSR